MKTQITKFYQLIVAIILLCNVGIINAQEDEEYNIDPVFEDHLIPSSSIFDVYNYQFEYYSKIRKILFNGLTDSPEIRFFTKPSFTPENVLDIYFDNKTKKYYLIFHICKKRIWYNKQWKKIKVKEYKSEIDKASVELIKSLFDIAISQTLFIKPENEMLGTDGTDYYFSINNSGLKTGTIWSPPEDSKLGKLINISNQLIKLAKSRKSVVTFDEELQNNIKELINEFKL